MSSLNTHFYINLPGFYIYKIIIKYIIQWNSSSPPSACIICVSPRSRIVRDLHTFIYFFYYMTYRRRASSTFIFIFIYFYFLTYIEICYSIAETFKSACMHKKISKSLRNSSNFYHHRKTKRKKYKYNKKKLKNWLLRHGILVYLSDIFHDISTL